MKRIIWIGSVMLFGLLVWAESVADYLEVRRDTGLKAQPNRNAVVVGRVADGAFLPLLNDGAQVNGYYNVRPSAPGQIAWIYRSLVRRWYGEIPVPVGYRAELDDYSGNGYDRGHMAPAEDMNRSQRTMAESFLLTNMAPRWGRVQPAAVEGSGSGYSGMGGPAGYPYGLHRAYICRGCGISQLCCDRR